MKTTANSEDMLKQSTQYLTICFAGLVFVFIYNMGASILRARGDTLFTTIFNLCGIVLFRVVWISLFGYRGNIDWVIASYPISWIITATMISIYYYVRTHKKNPVGIR